MIRHYYPLLFLLFTFSLSKTELTFLWLYMHPYHSTPQPPLTRFSNFHCFNAFFKHLSVYCRSHTSRSAFRSLFSCHILFLSLFVCSLRLFILLTPLRIPSVLINPTRTPFSYSPPLSPACHMSHIQRAAMK